MIEPKPDWLRNRNLQTKSFLIRAAKALPTNDPAEARKREKPAQGLIVLANHLGDRQRVAKSLFCLGDLQLSAEEYEKCVATFTRASAIFRGHDAVMLSRSELDRAIALSLLTKLPEAAKALKGAIALLQKAKEGYNETVAWTNLSDVQQRLGQNNEAEESLKKALAISERIHDPQATGNTLITLGNLQYRRNDFRGALATYRKAKPIYSKMPDHRVDLATVYSNMVSVQVKLGDFKEADANRAIAAKIYLEVRDYRNLATLRMNVGAQLLLTNQPLPAIDELTKAAKLAEKVNDFETAGLSKVNIATAWIELGDYAKARAVVNDARTTFMKTGSPMGDAHVDTVQGLAAEKLASRYPAQRDILVAEALRCDLRAASFYSNPQTSNQSYAVIALLNAAGAARLSPGKSHQADLYVAQAIGKIRQSDRKSRSKGRAAGKEGPAFVDPATRAQAYLVRGEIAMSRSRPGAAEKDLKQALDLSRHAGQADLAPFAAYVYGQALSRQGKRQASIRAFQLALELSEGLRAFLPDPTVSAGFLPDLDGLPSDIVRTGIDVISAEQMFRMVERGHLYRVRRLVAGEISTASLTERERNELARRSAEYQTSGKRKDLLALEQYGRRLRVRNPGWAVEQREPAPLSLVAKELGEDHYVLELLASPNGLSGMLVFNERGRTQVVAKRIELSEDDCQRIVSALSKTFQTSSIPSADVSGELRHLDEKLIQPFRQYLKPQKTLVVCPSGVLAGIPFSALLNRSGRYLIEDFAVVQAPSASAWYSFRRMSSGKTWQGGQGLFVGVGKADPTNPGAKPPKLAWKDHEGLDLLIGKGGLDKVIPLENDAATTPVVLRSLPSARVVHFAAEGHAETDFPLMSHIDLWPSRVGTPNRLFAKDVLAKAISAKMVVLAACDSARGRTTRDGLMGLAWAFATAGTPTIVGTLWQVAGNDVPSWTASFYSNLHTGGSPARAYQKACVHMIRTRGHGIKNIPSWAPWVLIGSDL